MNCSEQYHVTAAEWLRLQAVMSRKLGIDMSGDSGKAITASARVPITWVYDRSSQQLTVTEYVMFADGKVFRSGVVKPVSEALAAVRGEEPVEVQ